MLFMFRMDDGADFRLRQRLTRTAYHPLLSCRERC